MSRGSFGLFLTRTKYEVNVGTAWRSCGVMGADFMGIVGALKTPPRGRPAASADPWLRQGSDTVKAWKHVPLSTVETIEALHTTFPSHRIVAIEQREQVVTHLPNAQVDNLPTFDHPERAIYLLGREDHGFTRSDLYALDKAGAQFVEIITAGPCTSSLNLAVTASIVIYDRLAKEQR